MEVFGLPVGGVHIGAGRDTRCVTQATAFGDVNAKLGEGAQLEVDVTLSSMIT